MSVLQNFNRENELVLNTPKRLEILREGLPINHGNTNLLGRGAYGTVIKAIYKAKPVAVKIIKNLQNKQTVPSEANVLGWLHPNIVRIFKIESTPNFSIVVMERFNGHCLQKVLDTIELPLIHRVFIALDILSGLTYCHKNYLLHMDIKPLNVMIQMMYPMSQEYLSQQTEKPYRSYKCKLCDFGSSIKLSKENPQARGLAKGTLRYMAPEVLREEYLTPAADVFAFGITLWQMSYRLMPYYWLECNEMVAYQVVKHKLRPNALQSNIQEIEKYSNNDYHHKCLCGTNSEHFSYHSLENLRNILNKTKCELITDQISSAKYPWKRMVSNRKPLHDLNANCNKENSNVKRDLQQDFIHLDTFALMNMFKNTNIFIHTPKKEQRYEEIFKSCWHSDFTQRPKSWELIKRFKKFL